MGVRIFLISCSIVYVEFLVKSLYFLFVPCMVLGGRVVGEALVGVPHYCDTPLLVSKFLFSGGDHYARPAVTEL